MSKFYDGTDHVFFSESGTTVTIRAKTGQTLVVDGTGTIPAIGSDTQVLYNSAGSVVGSSSLTFNGSRLSVDNEAVNADEQSTTGGAGAMRVAAGGLYVHKTITCNGSIFGANMFASGFSKSSGLQTIVTGTETLLTASYWNPPSISGGVYDTTKITYSAGLFTIGLTGNYIISYNIGFAANATGIRYSYIGISGQKYGHTGTNALVTGGTALTGCHVLKINAAEQFGIYVYQDSGADLLMAGTSIRGFITILRL